MVGARSRLSPGQFRFRRLACRLASVGLPWAALGCMMPMADLVDQMPHPYSPPSASVRTASLVRPHAPVVTTAAFHVDAPELPAPTAVAPAEAPPPLEAAMRLADEKNAQIARQRVSVEAAETAAAVAEHGHLPDHVREEPFRRRSADAHVWQQRVELARVRSEVLQDAGQTYVDWLTARRGEAITQELESYEQKLLKRARALARDEKSAQSLVESLEMTIAGRQAGAARLRQQAEAAAAKLAYLLNSGDHPPVSGDAALVPVDLADATRPPESLVQQSLESGPGVRELAGLEAALEKVVADARFLQAACNHTGCIAFCGRLKYAQDKVVEVRLAAEAYRLANVRLEDQLAPATLADVQQSVRGLEASHFAYLQAVAAYDKAEVRLLLLLGWMEGCTHPAP